MKTFLTDNKVVLTIAAGFLILAAVLLFTLSGGDDADGKVDAKPTPAQTESSKPTPEPTQEFDQETNEKIFVMAITNEYPELSGADAELIAGGYRICSDIKAGATFDDFVADALAEDIDSETYGFIIGAAVSALCPEHTAWAENVAGEPLGDDA